MWKRAAVPPHSPSSTPSPVDAEAYEEEGSQAMNPRSQVDGAWEYHENGEVAFPVLVPRTLAVLLVVNGEDDIRAVSRSRIAWHDEQ